MANIYLLRDPECQNFVSVYRGFAFVGETLEPHTRNVLQQVHRTIYNRLAGEPVCPDQCSRAYGNNTSRWCRTCKKWKKELEKVRKKRLDTFQFKETRSWEWPNDYNNIIEIFSPFEMIGKKIKLKDISTVTSVWQQCRQFNVRNVVRKRVKTLRNVNYGHNPELSVSDIEKANVFDALRDLVSDPEFRTSISVQEVIHMLNKIENSNQQDELIKSLETKIDINAQRQQQEIFDFRNEIITTIEESNQLQDDSMRTLIVQSSYKYLYSVLVLLFVLLISHGFITYEFPKWNSEQPKQFTTTSTRSDCLSEKYIFPLRQDLPLYGYLPNVDSFIGRKWLFHELTNSLLHLNGDKAGISVIADIGFGKSALVSHILCANESTAAYSLHRHVVAFHVCKFDVPSTRLPERFIRRLVGFFSMKSPEFSNIIAMLDGSSIIYDQEKCGLELEACFDQGLTIPLRHMTDSEKPWVIIIDAIDECFDEGFKKNAILDLFSNRMRRLPNWIRWFITSRNIQQLFKLKKGEHKLINANDTKNLKDIKAFVTYKLSSIISRPNITSKTFLEMIERFVELSEGNFMFISHMMHHLSHENVHSFNYHTLPSSINEIYELNFERQFPTTKSYIMPKQILEIILVSLNPLSKDEIFQVIRFSTNCSKHDFSENINKLSYFLSLHNDITFVHRSIYEWLKYNASESFTVSLKKGHEMISSFLMSKADSIVVDPVPLAIHVSQSQDAFLKKIFDSHMHKSRIIFNASDVQKLIASTNSVAALELVLRYSYDKKDYKYGSKSAAFVAAYKGNLEQLKYLITQGADIGYTVPKGCLFTSQDLFATLKAVKTDFLCGYGLLHIAAKHGHSEIVEYLLKVNSSLLYIKNSIALRASDIACENGHLKVLEIISKYDISIIDVVCLYHAARYDNVDIVEWITTFDIEVRCWSERDALEVFEHMYYFNESIVETSTDTVNFLNGISIKSIDKWWKVIKETPLHVAIRTGSISSANIIKRKYTELIECKDAFGRTPFLSSIIYNAHELFLELLEQRQDDFCGEISQHVMENKNLQIFQIDSHGQMCPKGATMGHLIAFYDRLQMLTTIHNSNLDVDWNKPDDDSLTPIHYATCQSSKDFLLFSKANLSGVIDFNSITQNGSTIWHLAIACRQPIIFGVLSNDFTESIPDIKDNNGMGLLHNLVKQEPYEEGYANNTIEFKVFTYLYKYNLHTIIGTDITGRNVLHYALKYGKYNILKLIYAKHSFEFQQMMRQKDVNGKSPIKYAIDTIDTTQYDHLKNKTDCYFFEMLFYNRYIQSTSMPKSIAFYYEISHIYILTEDKLFEFQTEYITNFRNIINCCPYLTHAVLQINNITSLLLKNQSISFFKSLSRASPYSIIAMAYSKSVVEYLHSCNNPFSNSPLHVMVYYSDFLTSVNNILPLCNYSYSFIHQLFGNPIENKRLSCPDINGLNIFHYALLGGNICTAQNLLNDGIKPTNDKIKHIDILFMALTSKLSPNTATMCFSDITEKGIEKRGHQVNLDFFLSLFFSGHTSFTRTDLCKMGAKRLSIVHLLALNKMWFTMKIIRLNFGTEVLECENRDGFTSTFLSHLFDKITPGGNTAERIKQSMIWAPQLNSDALHALFDKLQFSVPPPKSDIALQYCLTHHNSKRFVKNAYMRHKLYLCIQSLFSLKPITDIELIEQYSLSYFIIGKPYYLLFELVHKLLYTHFGSTDQALILNILKPMGKHIKSHFFELDKRNKSKLSNIYKALLSVANFGYWNVFNIYLSSMFSILLDELRLILIHQYVFDAQHSFDISKYTSEYSFHSYLDRHRLADSTTTLFVYGANIGAERYRYLDIIKDTVIYKRMIKEQEESMEKVDKPFIFLEKPLKNLDTVKYNSYLKEIVKNNTNK